MLPKKLPWELAQTQWPQQLDPLLSNPSNNASILTNVPLISATPNQVNHKLGRKLQGWRIIRNRQFLVTGTPTGYQIYDTQDTNPTPQLTLILTCTQGTQANPVLIDLEVF